MNVDASERLARLLVEARIEGAGLTDVPSSLTPASAEHAYAVDDRVAQILTHPIVGWKIGCTSEHAQRLLGSPGPFAGRIHSEYESGAQIGVDEFPADPVLEGEFAFTIGADLPPSGTGAPDREEVIAAVADVRASIEVVGGRFVDFLNTPLPLLMADAGANSAVVLSPAATDLDLEGLDQVKATMSVDGERTGAGTGADVLGHPITALCWLVEHLSARGIGLEAGQVVSTGTATQVTPLPAGSTAMLEIDGMAPVTLVRAVRPDPSP